MLRSMRSHIDHKEHRRRKEFALENLKLERPTQCGISKPVSRVEDLKKRAHLLGINQFGVVDC